MVHTLAEQHGMIATFMPKPFTHLTGNGCHFHMSLWRDGENVFLDEADPRGLGLSETAYHFVGGLKAHARAYSALTAPTVNSYKRLKLGLDDERRDVVAGLDLVRLQQPHPDAADPGARADRGPHDRRLLQPVSRRRGRARRRARRDRAAASTPASRTRRTSTRSRRRAPRRGLRTLPANLLEAIGELERDDVLRAALGRGRDEDYVDYYVRVKRDEWFRYHEQVTALGDPRVPDPLLSASVSVVGSHI